MTQPRGYLPTLKLRTQRVGDHVEVHVRDNGNGILNQPGTHFQPVLQHEIPDKGEGIVVQTHARHGGEIRVRTERGVEYTDMM